MANFNVLGSGAYVGVNNSNSTISRLTALINAGEKTFASDPASAASGARLASEIGKELADKSIIKNGQSAVGVGIGALDSMLESVNDAIAKAKEATDELMSSSDLNAVANQVKGLGDIVNTLKATSYEGNSLFTSNSFSIDGITLGGAISNVQTVDFSNITIANTSTASSAVTTLEGYRNDLIDAAQHFGNISNQLDAKLSSTDVGIQGLSEARQTRTGLDLPSLFSQLSDARFNQTQSAQFLVQDTGAKRQMMGMFSQL